LFLDFLYKKKCISCYRIQDSILCNSCIKLIQVLDISCNKCGFVLNNNICYHCNNNEIYFEKLFSIGLYSGLLKTLIYEYKYNKNKELSIIFSNLIYKKLGHINEKINFITSIPIHKEKLKLRGFNQAELFAKKISNKIGLKYLEILERVKNTKPQYSLSSLERKENLKNAFIVNKKNVKSNNIILVDDIYTTGTTIREACIELKKAGINKIYIVVIARAVE